MGKPIRRRLVGGFFCRQSGTLRGGWRMEPAHNYRLLERGNGREGCRIQAYRRSSQRSRFLRWQRPCRRRNRQDGKHMEDHTDARTIVRQKRTRHPTRCGGLEKERDSTAIAQADGIGIQFVFYDLNPQRVTVSLSNPSLPFCFRKSIDRLRSDEESILHEKVLSQDGISSRCRTEWLVRSLVHASELQD
jgi:hypothetical protein